MPLLSVSQAAMCPVLWFGTLTHFTQHTLYLVHALKAPEGDLCQNKKKPFPFYSLGRSHGNA